MKKLIINSFFIFVFSIFFSGCVQDALPMKKEELLNITKGDSFEPTHFAYFDKASYRCDRVSPDGKEKLKILWEQGTWKNFELYNYQRNGYYGKRFEVKDIVNSLNDFYVFEKREDCIKFAEPKGTGNSIDVYVH